MAGNINTHEIEQRSLTAAKWANLVMGVAGIVAAIASNASALMLDGLFSGVNFLAAIFAARVAASVRRKPDALRPFGYEIDEPIYVMFRALVLTGIIIGAGFIAVDKIADYALGAEIEPVKLDWVVAYMAFMLAICAGRSLFTLAYIRPTQTVSAASLDTLHDEILQVCRSVYPLLRLEIIPTDRMPYE